MKIEFFVRGTPVAQPRQRHSLVLNRAGQPRIHNYTPARSPVSQWKELLMWQAKACRPKAPLRGALLLRLLFHLPRPKHHFNARGGVKPGAPAYKSTKPDFDNLAKAVADALTQMGYWQDDGQIAVAQITKQYHAEPGVWITVETLEDSAAGQTQETHENQKNRS